MRELSQWVFEVVEGERISLQVISVQFEGNYVGVGLDQPTLSRLEGPDYALDFVVSKAAGLSHVVIFEFNFPVRAPDSAHYRVNISSSRSGDFVRTVVKSDPNHDRDLVFAVTEASKEEPASDGQDLRVGEAGEKQAKTEPMSRGFGFITLPVDDTLETAETLATDATLGDLEFRGIVSPGDKASSDPSRRNYKRAKPPLPSTEKIILEDLIKPAAPGPTETTEKSVKAKAPETRPIKPRIVNVGFAPRERPLRKLEKDMPLARGKAYYFWLEVGRLLKANIDVKPESLPAEGLPPEALLKVVLFPFKGELQVDRGPVVGELRLRADGSVAVASPAAKPVLIKPGSRVLSRRLFFPVRTPRRIGIFGIRCNIYHKQVLLQSRLIRATVVEQPRKIKGALRSTVDYTIAKTLSTSHLAGMEPHRLSIMLNDNRDGTHGLRFWGDGDSTGREFQQNATISGQKLQDLIRQTRGGLRKISWGDEEQWQATKPYRYDGPPRFDRLKEDLIVLAKRGFRFYDGIIDHFTKNGSHTADSLAELMLKPGYIQVALKESATLLLPASLLYDYPLDDGLKTYRICPAFAQDFKAPVPLERSDCFNGLCPSRMQLDTVCPSGFWGYRHLLGLPLSVAGADNAPTRINWENAPRLTVAVSTDLSLYQQHEKAIEKELKTKWPDLGWNYAETRELTLRYLKDKASQIVYFYCHGGLDNNAPYIKVGPRTEDKLTRGNLRSYRIRWVSTRPLVFINGCHTTAVEPEQALEFVSGFVEVANASGVIGTEITVFEPLAKRFAEHCLRRFMVEGQSIGEAIRGARLELLKEANPLGLVYVPFVMANLRMEEQPAGDK